MESARAPRDLLLSTLNALLIFPTSILHTISTKFLSYEPFESDAHASGTHLEAFEVDAQGPRIRLVSVEGEVRTQGVGLTLVCQSIHDGNWITPRARV